MKKEHFYHMFANGDDAKNFITSEREFKSAFNRFAVCSHMTGVVVLSFSIEDSHPHSLLWGTYENCLKFKRLYESSSIKSIVQSRGSADGVVLECELLEIKDKDHLMNTAAYTIVQPTKDGKSVMPYDYLYGTGALYFRSKRAIMPWMVNDDGSVAEIRRFGDLTVKERRLITASRHDVPYDWIVCNGFILPTNYVDVKGFERIFVTHNCFRAFLSSGKKKDEQLLSKMAEVRGVVIEDLEARAICRRLCVEMFGKETTRHLMADQRVKLAQKLRRSYRLAYRQISFLVHIPEDEIRKFVK